MDLSIVAITYEEPDFMETVKSIQATGLPAIYVPRIPSGIGSLAEAINRGVRQAETRYVWIVTNITFDPDVPEKLCSTLIDFNADAIHPQFNSDHKHIREGEGVKEVPFIEFTAALIDKEKWIPLDENCPYWGHDLIHGYETHKKGGKILVDHTITIGHTYIRNAKPHPITVKRKELRRATDQKTREYLAKKYGPDWRGVIFPKTEKQIVDFYRQVKKVITTKTGKVICIDVDGVLTDGKIWVNHNGEIIKSFHSSDLTGIKELIANGFEVNIVTASSWPGAENYLKKSGAKLHIIRNKEEIPFEFDIAVGDSAWDIPMFRNAKECFCPADAPEEIRTLDGMNVLETKGGQGVLLELCRVLCFT